MTDQPQLERIAIAAQLALDVLTVALDNVWINETPPADQPQTREQQLVRIAAAASRYVSDRGFTSLTALEDALAGMFNDAPSEPTGIIAKMQEKQAVLERQVAAARAFEKCCHLDCVGGKWVFVVSDIEVTKFRAALDQKEPTP